MKHIPVSQSNETRFLLANQMEHATDKKRLYRHLELRNDHRSFLGEALFLLAHLAVGNANDVNHCALFLTGVAVAHGVISRREDRPLQHTHGSRGKLGKA